MDVLWINLSVAVLYFVVFELRGLVESAMSKKVAIAEARRDAKMYEAEIARISDTA